MGLVFGVSKKTSLASWLWALIVYMYMYIYIYTSLFTYTNIYYIHEVFEGIHLGICTISDPSSDSPQLWLFETTFPKKAVKVVVDSKTHYCAACSGTPGVNPKKNRSGEDVLFGQKSVELFKTDELVWFDTMICMNICSNIFTYTWLIYTINLYAHEPTNVFTYNKNIDK